MFGLLCFRWRSALLWRTFFTTAIVAVVLRSLINFCRGGHCGLFGQGGLIMFDMHSESPSYNNADLLAVVLIGVLGGLFGSLYNYLVDKVLRIYTVINEYVCPPPSPFSLHMFLYWQNLMDLFHLTDLSIVSFTQRDERKVDGNMMSLKLIIFKFKWS